MYRDARTGVVRGCSNGPDGRQRTLNRSEIHERSDRRDQYYDNRRYQGDNGNPFRDHGP
jgi:hypothetical protein